MASRSFLEEEVDMLFQADERCLKMEMAAEEAHLLVIHVEDLYLEKDSPVMAAAEEAHLPVFPYLEKETDLPVMATAEENLFLWEEVPWVQGDLPAAIVGVGRGLAGCQLEAKGKVPAVEKSEMVPEAMKSEMTVEERGEKAPGE